MTSESKINVATGFNGGLSVSLRADSAAELEALLTDATTNSPTLAKLLVQAGLGATEQQAVANVQQAFPGAQVVQFPTSTVGQPVPPPAPQQVAGPVGIPPGVAYPGDCAHGPRVYVDKPAKGRAWRRFECAIPWSRDNAASRCKPVNVEG